MSQSAVRQCPGCGQTLRFPEGVGGVLMACPECEHRFASPFRLAGAARPAVSAAAPIEPAPAAPPAKPNLQATSLAARVAALYASNS